MEVTNINSNKNKWIIRLGNRKLDNIFRKGDVITGDVCAGVSVFEIETDIKPESPLFPSAILGAIVDADKFWKQAFVYPRSHFDEIMDNIPETWRGKKGIINAEPPKNHRELWGFLVTDVKKIFNSYSAIRMNLSKAAQY